MIAEFKFNYYSFTTLLVVVVAVASVVGFNFGLVLTNIQT